MLRLFTSDIIVTRKARVLCYATIAIIFLWAIGSIVGTAISCPPSNYVRDVRASHNSTPRMIQWRLTAAFDVLTELLLVLLPIMFVWPINMRRRIKTQVAIAFGFRLPLIAIAVVHLHYVLEYSRANSNPRAIIPALVLQQCELLWSLISATIPTLKKFMQTFSSGFGMEIDLDTAYGHRSGPHNYKTYTLGSGQRSTGFTMPIDPDTNVRQPQRNISNTEVPQSIQDSSSEESLGEPHTRPQSGYTSHSSQEMIIKREVGWRVSYEDRQQQ